MTGSSFAPVRAFYCFDPVDRAFCEALDLHLVSLKRDGRLQAWDERQILAGQGWEQERDQHLSTARLLILLISPDFLASKRGQQDLQVAMDRQQAETATILPILIRPCAWEQTVLSSLQLLPRDHRALTQQSNRDAAWTEIIQEISRMLVSVPYHVYLILAPEDQSKAVRLSEELAHAGVTAWYLKDEHLSAELDVEREAMRQASLALLVASPTAFNSRIVRTQKELAETYQRPIEVVWTREEDDEWETAGIWHRGNVRMESDRAAKVPLLTHLKKLVETVTLPEQPPPQIAKPRDPYKGLRSFTAADTHDFFGRDALINTLTTEVEHLLAQEREGSSTGRLLAVLGASGSGKSSVVLAGLLPRLKDGGVAGSDAWLYLDPITPGAHPLEALALTLSQQPSLDNAPSLHRELRSDSRRAFHLLVCQLIGSSSRNVVLFIDQFEELFSPQVSEEDRQHFLDLLIAAVTEPTGPLLVIVTMRVDFLDRAMQYSALYRPLDAHHVTVLPMEREDLRQVIEAPARLPDVQMDFEGDLVGDLLFEMREQIGALPLLSFTLDQLFAARQGQLFTLSAYRAMGGVKGALTKHAEATYDALPSKEHQTQARSLFLRLIDPGHSEADMLRRRAGLSEFDLPDQVQTRLLRETIDTFLGARLLTSNKQAGVATVEVSHEALIREWPRLIEWLSEAREDIQLQHKVSEDATIWQQRGRPQDRLYHGSQLKEARAWARRNSTSQQEGAFLLAATRRRRYLLLNIVALVLVLMATVSGALWSYIQFQRAQAQIHDPARVTTLANDGVGSLRWAINNVASGKIITFAPSLRGSIVLTDTLFIPHKQLHIQGPSATENLMISNPTHTIEVDAGASIIFSNLTFTGSDSNQSSLLTNGAGSRLTLINSTISGNTHNNSDIRFGNPYGGGIDNKGTLVLINSTVSDNRADIGGGIENEHTGTLTLINSTIWGNLAMYGCGGIDNFGGTIMLLFSTLMSTNGMADICTQDYVGPTLPSHAFARNSLIGQIWLSSEQGIEKPLISQGNNLLRNPRDIILQSTDHIGDPKLAPVLRFNGGPTKTDALLPGSPAIDAIPSADCHFVVSSILVATDQRGIKRPQGPACDIGAYEYAP